MLKINLLPIRQLKKRAKAKKQLFSIFFLFLLVLAMLGAVGFLQTQNINTLQKRLVSLNKEKDSYSATLKRIDELKKARAELERRTNVIDKLKAESSLTVRVIDEVANRVDNKRIWLQSLNQQNSSLRLTGIALDNQTVAQFMDSLKASPFITSVTLTNSSLKIVSGRNLKAFSINCSVAQPKAPKTETVAAK
ncbi:MAG: PilN domain-containing protein [Deltaproteobacteria bacterium]|nr:PilN domain-containing protein [Deltaproteobacteria bacterium]MBW2659777.1 PilN domain-containing protein [Deltaproteobacteria bacterium]